jgi:hypothetical protein
MPKKSDMWRYKLTAKTVWIAATGWDRGLLDGCPA